MRRAGRGTGLAVWVAALGVGFCVASSAAPAVAQLALPMVGGPGEDADGYPLATVDKLAVLRQLRARQFDTVESWIVTAQDEFEADSRKEYWVLDALDAFATPDPTLKPLLDAWIDDKPDSWAALLARGMYRVTVGWNKRGYRWADETPPENFAAMLAVHRQAAPDLVEALARHPAAIAGYRGLLKLGMANGGPRRLKRKVLDEAVSRCHDCFQIRVTYMMTLKRRWGGDTRKMAAFAEESARASSNPKMRLLAGYADWDRCDDAYSFDQYAAALTACDEALKAGEHWEFLSQRSDVLWMLDRDAEALADLDKAVAARPQDRHLLRDRAKILKRLGLYARFVADVDVLREIDPVEGLRRGDLAIAAQWRMAQRANRRPRR